MASVLAVESTRLERQFAGVTRFRWGLLILCCLVLPSTTRVDGIDLLILIGNGVGIFLPLLLFNAPVEAPIMARFSTPVPCLPRRIVPGKVAESV